MGLLDFLQTSPSYHANRIRVKRWLLTVQFPEPEELEELPFADLNLDYDLVDGSSDSDDQTSDEDEEPQPSISVRLDFSAQVLGMPKFDYSTLDIAYSTWQDPFTQPTSDSPPPQYNATYTETPVTGRSDLTYKRPLPAIQNTIFNHPGIQEEPPSDEDLSDNDFGIYNLPVIPLLNS